MAILQVSLRYLRDGYPVHGPVPEAHRICQRQEGRILLRATPMVLHFSI